MIIKEYIDFGTRFLAPRNVTFGMQGSDLVIWFSSTDDKDCTYMTAFTGGDVPSRSELIQTYHNQGGLVFHLLRL